MYVSCSGGDAVVCSVCLSAFCVICNVFDESVWDVCVEELLVESVYVNCFECLGRV